jgi:integrase
MMITAEAITLFLNSRSAKGDSQETIDWYAIILEYFRIMYPGDLPDRPDQIDKFLLSCKGGDERRYGFFRTLRALYRFLYRRYDIPNVMAKVDPPRRKKKLPKSLSLDEFIKLFSHPHDPRIMAYLKFLADTGARIGELHNLKADDIHLTPRGYIAKLNGKTGGRYAPILDSTYQTVIKYLPVPYCLDYLGDLISRAFKDAGVKGSAHSLRHTFGTMWEGSEFALQDILGHANFEMLKNYRRLRTYKLSELHKLNTPLLLIENVENTN